MSSSTSSFESALDRQGDGTRALAWRGFLVRTLAVCAGLGLSLFAGLVALDPYDTGRFGLVHKHGVLLNETRLGDASRLHDEGFDAAIFGNSHILPLSSARLSADTGLSVMTLAIAATGVPEQMLMLDAYLARHTKPRALIVAVDWLYCLDEPSYNPRQPFPDWLYTSDRAAYVAALFQMRSVTAAVQRIEFLLGWRKPLPRDGVTDIYENHQRNEAAAAATITAAPREDYSSPPQTHMPGFAMLAERLNRISRDTVVVLVLPPVAAAWLPRPGTAAASSVQACKDRAFALAANRSNVRIVDWHRAMPQTEDLKNFWDPAHFYDPVARLVERDIAAAFREMGIRRD